MDEQNILNEVDLGDVNGGGTTAKIKEYTVKQGDTLHKIAKHYNCTVDDIMRLNSIIKDRNLIRVGWVLRVPDCR